MKTDSQGREECARKPGRPEYPEEINWQLITDCTRALERVNLSDIVLEDTTFMSRLDFDGEGD